MSARYAVLGDPIEHSLSPRIFTWLARHFGLTLEYSARRVTADHLAGVFDEARRGSYLGFSVTLPLKEVASTLVDSLEDTARQVGAVNCVRRLVSGALEGHNTDVIGVARALERAGRPLGGARVLVLGAGGGARAAVHAAVHAGAASVVVANRDVPRAERLVAAVGQGRAISIALEREALEAAVGRADIVVQATSVGLSSGASVLPPGVTFRPGQMVMDMVYRPLETALLAHARSAGATVVDGLWMLVFQALAQLTSWTGKLAHEDVAAALHSELKGAVS